MSKRVLVPLAQGCEELEAVTIMDLLVRAGIEVVSASLDDDLVITASRGTQLIAKARLEDIEDEQFDLIVLPGGLPGSDYLQQNARLQSMLVKQVENQLWVAAICAAPKALASAGILEGRTATSYPGVLAAENKPNIKISDAAVVVDEKVVTSMGPGTAIDFTLTLIEQLLGREARDAVEQPLMLKN